VRNILRELKPKVHEAVAHLPLLPRALRLVWTAAGRWTLAWAGLLLLQAVLPVAIVLLTREFVDSVVAVVGTEVDASLQNTRAPLLLAAAMAALLLVAEFVRALAQWARVGQSEMVSDHIRGLIHERAAAVDMGFYDSPGYFDILHRARQDAQNRPIALIENLGTLAQGGVTLIAMSAVLAAYSWWLPLVLLLSAVPALVVVLQFIVRQHRWRMMRTTEQRRSVYFERMLSTREAFAEVRLYGLAAHFRDLFQRLRAKLRGERLDLARSEAWARIWAGFSGLLLLGGSLVWMLRDALRGSITLGELAMFGQAFAQGQKLARTSLENVGQIYANLLFLGNLFEFLDLEPGIVDPPEPTPLPPRIDRGLVFRDVTFTYPIGSRPALVDFNLDVPAGATVALLGRNGAGKSTLFKLLLRFYDPESGTVEIDGIDLRHLSLAELRRRISVLFQVPLCFSATVGENVAYGDLLDNPDSNRIRAALRAAGADDIVGRCSEGVDTMLGPWFGGTELSRGEWQRLALSRAFLRDADIVLLDEPTSSMDSWAEAEWLGRFLDHVAHRTTLVITHRLTTARHADVIHLIDGGTVVESGDHETLLKAGARYAEAWHSQDGERR
jgi:ATP-binding cassette subfamily B protein